MPKIKPIIPTDPRFTELRGKIAEMQVMSGKSYPYLCKKAGINYGTFMNHRKHIEQMRFDEFWKFSDACRKESNNV